MRTSYQNPILTAARAAMGEGATFKDLYEDMTGYQIAYPGADGFSAVWDAPFHRPACEGGNEQAIATIGRGYALTQSKENAR